jgi:hypothetical protein
MAFFMVALLLLGLPFVWIGLLSNRSKADSEDLRRKRATLIAEHGLDHVVTGSGASFVGLKTDCHTILIHDNSALREFSYDQLRAVSLVPVNETISETTGEQRTNRGSQIIGAAVGSALAGPAGLVVGGLSGSTSMTSTTQSNEHLADLELELRLNDEDAPRITLHAGKVGAFGNRFVKYEQGEQFKDMAARLVNIVESISAPAH